MIAAQADAVGGMLDLWESMLGTLVRQPGKTANGDAPQTHAAGSPLDMFARAMRSGKGAVAQALERASSGQGELAASLAKMFNDWGQSLSGLRPWPGAPGVPFSPGIEVAFGGVADALGLGPPRRLAAALQALAAAQEQQQRAWLALQQLVVQRWPEVAQRTIERVASPADGATVPESVSDVLSVWAANADEVGHDALHGETGAKALADCIRAATAAQMARNQVGEIACEMMNLPTRREVDEAFLEIQKVKRQLRRSVSAVAPATAAAPARKKPARSAKPAAGSRR